MADLLRRAAASLALLVVMVAGVLVLGRLAGTAAVAMALTTAFFVALAGALLVLVRRRRDLAVPLGATYVLVAGAAGIVLGLPLVTDEVVAEDVAVQGGDVVATGSFQDRAHPGEGTATLVDAGAGGQVLTLTGFRTDNGPDLFVYLVPAGAPAGSVEGFVDLGRLSGNVGDQRYEVPDGVAAGEGWRVVVWCRAFAVPFTEAALG